MKNFAWGTESFNDKPIYVVLFVARNKDNSHIEGFSERYRRVSFITHEEWNSESLKTKFKHFVEDGKPGEFCRMYYSVNERDSVKIHKALLHFIIEEPNFNLCSIAPKLAGIAAQKECAKSKHWMFDFDIDDIEKAKEFCAEVEAIKSRNKDDKPVKTEIRKTPHGYAIITDRGFDLRELNTDKWGNVASEHNDKGVTLKRDDLLCVAWATNTKEN